MVTIRLRRGLKQNLPTLRLAELGFATDTNELFIGTDRGNLKLFPLQNFWHILNPINVNTWYIPYAIGATALTTLALSTNRIYYIPFVSPINCMITQLAVEVTTASAGTGQIGVYNSNNFRPFQRLGTPVDINTGTTGVKSGNTNVSIVAGELYFLALINTAGATIRAVAVGSLHTILGIATGTTAFNTHYFEAGSGGVLPATANASSSGTGAVPCIYVRYSLS